MIVVRIKYFIATISSIVVSFPPTVILGKQWHQLVVKSHNQDTLGWGWGGLGGGWVAHGDII